MIAAFDTVDHALLLSKLEQCYGICEKVYDWISSYLKDRSETVHYQSSNSTRWVLKYGNPQGSVLGPALFLLYTGEINHVIDQYNLQSQCYADGCQVHSSCQPDKKDELIKSTLICIEELSLWMESNRLKLNPDKTQFMWLTPRGRQHLIDHSSIVAHGINIKPSSTVRLLGVYVDEAMSFETHIRNVLRTCFFQFRQLKAIQNCIPLNTAKH